MMAWARTSVSLIGFGFTILKFFEALGSIAGVAPAKMGHMPRYLGLLLIGSGTAGLAAASIALTPGAAQAQHEHAQVSPRGSSRIYDINTFEGVTDIAQDPTAIPLPITRTTAETVRVDLETVELEARLDSNATYTFWTFNGRVPGPFLRVRVGDQVEVHLKNNENSMMMHNVDLHAVTGPGGGAEATSAAPGEEKSFTFRALNPGIFVYHCAVPPVAQHISNGMYGLILVEPPGGLTPLMFAARENCLACLPVLLESGADLNATTPDGISSAVLALINGHFDVAGALVEAGIDPNLADYTGRTALYAAIDFNTMVKSNRPAPKVLENRLTGLDVARIALEHGADVNARLKRLPPYRAKLDRGNDTMLGGGTTAFLRAAKAGDLPVEQPTKFEMIINLKTAKAIHLTIPESFLLRAQQVIE